MAEQRTLNSSVVVRLHLPQLEKRPFVDNSIEGRFLLYYKPSKIFGRYHVREQKLKCGLSIF